MFSDPSSATVAGVQSVVVAAAFLGLGYLVVDALFARLQLDSVTTWGLAVGGSAVFVTVVMILHIVTGGGVLSDPVIIRTLTGAGALLLAGLKLRRALKSRRPRRIGTGEVLLLCGLVLLGLVLWCRPVFSELPLDFRGDTKRHLVWASQLVDGESTTSGVITGEIPNYYPWLFHGVLAFLARFTPGGRALHAFGPMQVFLVTGSTLALFAAGRALGRRVGTAIMTAVFGALAGGFGWLVARGPALILDPRDPDTALRYWGDLFQKRSYSFSFNNLVPPFPRDLTFALITVLVVLLVIGLTRRSTLALAAAGTTLGMIGLTGGEALIVGGLIVMGVVALGRGVSLVRRAAALMLPAAAVYAVWIVPIAVNYVRLEGFGNTAGGLVALPPSAILGAWGIVTPFAVYGALRLLPKARTDPGALLALIALAAGVAGLAFASLIPALFGEGFMTLGRSHRYWPLACFGVALCGGLGAGELVERLWDRTRTRSLAIAAGLAITAAAVMSPWFGTSAVSEIPVDPLLASSLRGDRNTVLNVLAPEPGGSCVAAVPFELSRPVGSYAGYRLVLFPGSTKLPARIRWVRLPNAISQDERSADNQILISGQASPERWRRAAEKYQVDVVVMPSGVGPPWIQREYTTTAASGSLRDYDVVWLNPECRSIPVNRAE